MSDVEILRRRIDRAVQQLNEVHTTRRQSNDSLMGLLGDLESKYRARDEELVHCTRRIEALEADQGELTHLVAQLVGIMESWAGQGTEDPVFRATAKASDMLDELPPLASPATDDIRQAHWIVEQPDAPEPPVIELPGPPGFDPSMSFADVAPDLLAAERAHEIVASDLPAPLIEAIAEAAATEEDADGAAEISLLEDEAAFAAESPAPISLAEDAAGDRDAERADAGDVSPDDLADMLIQDMTEPVDIEIPEMEGADEPPDPASAAAGGDAESHIRAMMARLEEAADRAREAHHPEARPRLTADDPPITSRSSS